VHFETTLNLIWLALGFLTFANTIRVTLHRTEDANRARPWLHIAGVALILAALFPYISATDDVLRIEHFSSQQNHQHSQKRSPSDDLMRLYEAMDTPLLCGTCQVVLTFSFISLVVPIVASQIERIASFEAGRSPPLFFAI
jgi:hypothetical protein